MKSSPIVVTGASGFIGKHFLDAARARDVRALSRSGKDRGNGHDQVRWIEGNLASAKCWQGVLEAGCTVINLAYPKSLPAKEAVTAARHMVAACAEYQVARLIHCSTVSVYGRTEGGVIDESTLCKPQDDYGRTKLAIEEAILSTETGACDVGVIRPAAVFGAGGRNLVTLAQSLQHGSNVSNYLRASLFGRRKMHLVPVESVVAALLFLCDSTRPLSGNVFNVAEDDNALNNFQDIERMLAKGMGVEGRCVSPLPIPPWVLRMLLRSRGRSEVDPNCVYRADKIRAWGFVSPVCFEEALMAFSANFRSNTSSRGLS
ncbi:NAD-dependent epimerase/dehydratase family protein [Denitratisoma sp. agr-D3]